MNNYNKGTKYLNAGRYDKALASFKKCKLDIKELYVNMGNCYRWYNDLETAEKLYIKANSSDVPYADGKFSQMYTLALNNLGLLYYARGDDDTAVEFYKHALTIDPVYYDALWNLGNALLRRFLDRGENPLDWDLGWKLYEYRFKRNNPTRIDNVLERWDGSSKGGEIVVLTEQGLGDKIMFGRYLSRLREYFSEVYVQCHPSLDVFYSDYKIIRDPVEVITAKSIPICSLAGIFGMMPGDWLKGKFNARKFEGFNIGCVWSGSTTHANDRNRSCSSNYFSSLRDFGNLHSLNPGARVPKGINDISSTSWSDTISNVLGMDVVVTVDTSIVHLCGSLGVPCIMIQPVLETDFRWGHGRSTDWYDSVIIVPNRDWSVAFKEVKELLSVIQRS